MTQLKAKPQLSAILLCSFLALAACAPSSNEGKNISEPISCEISGSSFGIVGGSTLGPNNEVSASTVMILSKSSTGDMSICSATLIADDKVLTAAHCAKPDRRSVIVFSNNIECGIKAKDRTMRLVVDHAVHPNYNSLAKAAAAENDLAVLKFSGGLPENFKVQQLPSESLTIPKNGFAIAAGYGVTVEKGDDSGVLRFTTAATSRLSTSYVTASNDQVHSLDKTLVLKQPENGVCSGDSGGPLYIKSEKGSPILIGVASMVTDNTAKTFSDYLAGRSCHGVGLFVDVRQHLDWIEEQLEK